MEEAGDADIVAEGAFTDGEKALFEGKGSGSICGERNCTGAQFGFGVEEDGLVDEVLLEEGSVEGGAGFEEEAADSELIEVPEDLGEGKAIMAKCQWSNDGALAFQGVELVCVEPFRFFAAEDPKVVGIVC